MTSPLDMAFYCLEWISNWMFQQEPAEMLALDLHTKKGFHAFSNLSLTRFREVHEAPQYQHASFLETAKNLLELAWYLHWKDTIPLVFLDDADQTHQMLAILPLALNRPFSLTKLIGLNVTLDHYIIWLKPSVPKVNEGKQLQSTISWTLTFCYLFPEHPNVLSSSSSRSPVMLTRNLLELALDHLVIPQLKMATDLQRCLRQLSETHLILTTPKSKPSHPLSKTTVVIPLSRERKHLLQESLKDYLDHLVTF